MSGKNKSPNDNDHIPDRFDGRQQSDDLRMIEDEEKKEHVKEHQAQIDIQPLVDIAIKHEHDNPQDAVQLLEVALQLVPNDPVVEHKLQQLS